MSKHTVSIADLAEVNPRTYVHELKPDDLVSFIPMADVSEEGRWHGCQECKLKEVQSGYTAFVENDVLFAKITPCMENGKGAHVTGLKNGVGFGSTEFHVLRTQNGNNARFLLHWLQNEETRLRAIAYMGGSAGQQRVQPAFFYNYRIPFFEPREQSRIAYVLDTIDGAIKKTEAEIAKLKKIREGMLHDLLTYGLDEHGQIRDPVAHPEQFKDSPLGRIPKDWRVVSLYEVLSMQAGNALTSEYIYEIGQYPVYGGNGIRGYTYTYTHNGTFPLIGRQGALCGNIVVASGKFYATEHAIVVYPKENMNIKWLDACLIKMRLSKYSESSAQAGLSVQKIMKRLINIPSFTEQLAIGNELIKIEKSIDSEINLLKKMFLFKSGLQKDLLSGRVRIPENLEAQLAEPG